MFNGEKQAASPLPDIKARLAWDTSRLSKMRGNRDILRFKTEEVVQADGKKVYPRVCVYSATDEELMRYFNLPEEGGEMGDDTCC